MHEDSFSNLRISPAPTGSDPSSGYKKCSNSLPQYFYKVHYKITQIRYTFVVKEKNGVIGCSFSAFFFCICTRIIAEDIFHEKNYLRHFVVRRLRLFFCKRKHGAKIDDGNRS